MRQRAGDAAILRIQRQQYRVRSSSRRIILRVNGTTAGYNQNLSCSIDRLIA